MSKLAPSVGKPIPRFRLGFLVALLLVLSAAVVTLLVRVGGKSEPGHPGRNAWAQLQPHCTPLEVDVTLRERQLEPNQRVLCLAVAGKVDRARETLLAMPSGERTTAVQALFAVAHPIADAGDDRSAGPIMHLVVELWPANYMAVFHAGMADFALGNDDQAQAMLTQFLGMYAQQDVWRERAQRALEAIAAHQPLGQREAHFPE